MQSYTLLQLNYHLEVVDIAEVETFHPPWIWLEAQEGHDLPEAGDRLLGHGGAVHHQGGPKVDLHEI